VLAAVLASGASASARADGRDTTYGRIEGDLAVAASVGAAFGPRGPRGAVDLRGRYLQTAGIFVTYEDGALLGSSAEPVRVLVTGLEARPLFLGRWLAGAELGMPVLDLIVDSLALELGASFAQPRDRAFGSRPGLSASLGLEVPLFGRASGLFVGVHGGARWTDDALGGGRLLGPDDRAGFLAVTLGWQQLIGTRMVGMGELVR
jgi:hypothetical protein